MDLTNVGPTFTRQLEAYRQNQETSAERLSDLRALLARRKAELLATTEAAIAVSIDTDPTELAQQKILQDAQAAVIAKIEKEIAAEQQTYNRWKDAVDRTMGNINAKRSHIASLSARIATLAEQRAQVEAELAQ